MEKTNMETIMKDVQVQPWWQYEDDITMFSETAVKEAMNKELAQLLSKKSFEENNKDSLTREQLQQVVATRWVIAQSPSNNGTKDIKCRFCGKRFSQFIHDTFFNGNAFITTHNRHHQDADSSSSQFSQPTWPHSSILQSTRKSSTTSKGILPQSSQHAVEDDKGALRSTHIAETMAGASQCNLTKARVYKTQEWCLCVRQQTIVNIH
eukprot:4634054-Amphidinium_carterae.2